MVADILARHAREHLDTNARDGIMSRGWTPIAHIRYDADARRAITELHQAPLRSMGADPSRIEVEIAAAPRCRGPRPPLAAAPRDVHFPKQPPADPHRQPGAPQPGSGAPGASHAAASAPHDGHTAHMPHAADNIFWPDPRAAGPTDDPNATPIAESPPPPPLPPDAADDDDARGRTDPRSTATHRVRWVTHGPADDARRHRTAAPEAQR